MPNVGGSRRSAGDPESSMPLGWRGPAAQSSREPPRDLLTPAVVHYGHAPRVIEHRCKVLLDAYRAHPKRFVNGPPSPAEPPTAVWINPPVKPRNKPSRQRTVLLTPRPEHPAAHEQAASAGPVPLVDTTELH